MDFRDHGRMKQGLRVYDGLGWLVDFGQHVNQKVNHISKVNLGRKVTFCNFF